MSFIGCQNRFVFTDIACLYMSLYHTLDIEKSRQAIAQKALGLSLDSFFNTHNVTKPQIQIWGSNLKV